MATTFGVAIPRSLPAHERLYPKPAKPERPTHLRHWSQWGKSGESRWWGKPRTMAVTAATLHRLNLDPSGAARADRRPAGSDQLNSRSITLSPELLQVRPAATAGYRRSFQQRGKPALVLLNRLNQPGRSCPRFGRDSVEKCSAATIRLACWLVQHRPIKVRCHHLPDLAEFRRGNLALIKRTRRDRPGHC